MKILISLCLVFFAASASAQDFSVDERLIDRCVAANPDTPTVCVGQQSRVCYDDYGGGADMVLTACFEAEQAYWDKALNRVYQELLVLAKREEDDDYGLQADQLTDAARQMQRSWIAYRDDTCGLDLARAYPFMSGAGPVLGECLARETARQYFQLERIAGSFRK